MKILICARTVAMMLAIPAFLILTPSAARAAGCYPVGSSCIVCEGLGCTWMVCDGEIVWQECGPQ